MDTSMFLVCIMIEIVTDYIGQVIVNEEFVGKGQIREVPVTRPHNQKIDVNIVLSGCTICTALCGRNLHKKTAKTDKYLSLCLSCKKIKRSNKFSEKRKDVGT